MPEELQRASREIAARHGQTFVPLVHLFSSKEDFANNDEVHPNREGHERITAAIVNALVPVLQPETDLIPSSS